MGNVAIVTDSTATLPEDLVKDLDIRVVPVVLVLGGETYLDGVDITPEEVYQRLRSGEAIPTSAAPSVGDFLRVYAAAGQRASAIVSIHMSPKLSSTHAVATTASELLDDVQIRVVDCQTAAIGQGFVVMEAALAAAAGANLDEVQRRIEEVAPRISLLFTLDTFEYLRRGGRIGGAAALAGTLLQIKPVLTLSEGRVEVCYKPRTKQKAIARIIQQMEEQVGGRPIRASVLHADALHEAEALRQSLADRFECVELLISEFTPVMGAHTGPGLLGVAFYVVSSGH
jgi:DegV family protein with EDD domain